MHTSCRWYAIRILAKLTKSATLILSEFARHMPCLQNAHFYGLQNCNQRCIQFKIAGGLGGLNPFGSGIGTGVGFGLGVGVGLGLGNTYGNTLIGLQDPTSQQMAADCQYVPIMHCYRWTMSTL